MVGELKSIDQGYVYIDERTEKWCIKENAPVWAIEEFNCFFGKAKPDEDGLVTLY